VALKAASLWTKLDAIYPFVGGTAATHKYNLKNPLDTDGAFRLTFSGGWTHSATGALPNGTTGYADTHFIPNTHLPANSGMMAYYSRTNTAAGDKADMGNYNWDATGWREHLIIRYTGDNFYYGMGEAGAVAAGGVTNSSGLFAASRTGASAVAAYRNGSSLATSTQAFAGHATNKTYIGKMNSYTAHSDRECAFACMGDGIDATENSNLYTAVQAFQTALGRNV
jgi:hypothetical protein